MDFSPLHLSFVIPAEGLATKRILVTGGTRGTGKAIADRLRARGRRCS